MMLTWPMLDAVLAVAPLWMALLGISALCNQATAMDILEWHVEQGKPRLVKIRIFPASYETRKVYSEGSDVPPIGLLAYPIRYIKMLPC